MTRDAQRWSEIAALFDELVEMPAPERARRLAQIALDDAALADEVVALLDADEVNGNVLDGGVSAAVPELLGEMLDAVPADGMAGPYRLLREIGEGGMGVVWLAERDDGAFEQQVAVKLLKRGMDTHAILRRFLQERRILARLHHAHIVRLLDGGMSVDGRPFYVMDYVDGEPITTYASRHPLDVRARVELLVKVAEAVAYAHAQLIVHRDLKPSNVLVDQDGEPRVLDFGIAKLIEESGEHTETGTGMRVLSPAYAAPEQILGEPIGTATDVYALGLMLCELLVGELPQRRRAAQLVQDANEETSARMSTLAARLPAGRLAELYGPDIDARRLGQALAGDLDLIVATALQREPSRRYAGALTFAADLKRWLQRRPIAARADSKLYRLRRFVRRHRLGVAAAVLVLLSLIGGLGVALWQAGEAREQAVVAKQEAARAERVKAFLVGIFRQSNPALAKGQELTAAEILRRGRAGLDAAMADDPLTHGELLMTIAEILGNLGTPGDAIAMADEAFAMLASHLPEDDLRLAQAYRVRGELYDYVDRYDDAERDLRNARAILVHHPDAYPEQRDQVETQLAFVLRNTQSIAAGLALQKEVVARVRARVGDSSRILADHRISLALLYEDAGDYALAEAEYQKALPVLTRIDGALAPRVCEAGRNYAGLLDRLGRSEQAEPHFERALACTEKLYGRVSVPYARTLFSRGILLLNQRRYAEAEADFRATLPVHGDHGSGAAHAHRYLGRALEEQGRYAEAVQEYTLAERIYREVDMPNDLQRWRARADRGNVLFKSGNVIDGRLAIEEALIGLHSVVPNGDTFEFLRPLHVLGDMAHAQGELEGAVTAHRREHGLALKIYGADSREAYRAAYALALDLTEVGTTTALAEAEAFMTAVIPLARADAAPDFEAIEQAARRIARVRATLTRAAE